ncbi:MAG: hypothetical protein ACRCUY_05765 [Thermoguttaceae bacterium]
MTTSSVSVGAPPQEWIAEWNNPSAKNRPLQIIHGWFGDRTTPEKLRYFSDKCGLGGLVINMPSKDYMRNETEWQRLIDLVRSAKEIGLRIWIYDEDGYPSLAAGGLVLEEHPELECMALVYDAEKDECHVRPAYEHTHASNKHAPLRRYPNPIQKGATKRFLEVTHDEYLKRLGDLHKYVEAYFTDEPSLNAVNIGQIPEHVRAKIQVIDAVNESIPLLPMVPWSETLENYLAENGGPINKKSLFIGDSESDRKERERFWSAVTDLNDHYFYREILDWCQKNNVAASGHMLHEENLTGHVPLDGNKIRLMRLFDIPGLDQLNSFPNINQHGGWKTTGFPCSAAALNGTRLVMTELSDFSQKMDQNDPKPASLDWMKAACAVEAVWGVTEFTFYYQINDRGEDAHKEYCNYIGHLNAILRDATPIYDAVLYYPISELQQEYRPTAEPLKINLQSDKMQKVVRSFDRIGAVLVRNQIPFIIADEQGVKDWTARVGNKMPLLIPQEVSIPAAIESLGLPIVRENAESKLPWETINTILGSARTLILPQNDSIVLGKFVRAGKLIYIVVNAENKQYEGKLEVPVSSWSSFDPDTGAISEMGELTNIPLSLKPLQTLIFVGSQ